MKSKEVKPTLVLRGRGPDSHLYDNNGTWWVHYSVLLAPNEKAQRRRASLGTKDKAVARERRDALFAHLRAHYATVGAEPVARPRARAARSPLASLDRRAAAAA